MILTLIIIIIIIKGIIITILSLHLISILEFVSPSWMCSVLNVQSSMFNVHFSSPVGSLCHTCTRGVVRRLSCVCYGNSRAMPWQRKLDRYSCWGIVHRKPHTHDFALSVKSPAYLICRTLPLYPELPNGPVSPLERSRYLGLKRNSHPRKENPGHHAKPVPEVAYLDLEAAGQGTGPGLQADPGLEPEPELTRAGLDLGPDLLSLKNAPI